MRFSEISESPSSISGGGWLNIKTQQFVPANNVYHVLSIFHNMEKFGLTPEKMKTIPAFAKWFKLDWSKIIDNDDPKELETWWYDLDIDTSPTLDGKINGTKGGAVQMDGDMEIINWMNEQGWVRITEDRDEIGIQGNNLRQVHRAARIIDRQEPIYRLYFDVNDLSSGMELSGERLQHFLKRGNVNFSAHVM